jgi:hypothetical protein
MKADFHLEFGTASMPKHGHHCCGDVFESRRLKDECRTIGVLSDGIGHGVKANILAALTTSMAIQFAQSHESSERTAQFIINSLPFDEKRKMPNATFSMIDVNYRGEATLTEYGNPDIIWMNGPSTKKIPSIPQIIDHCMAPQTISVATVKLKKEDRLILFSDGIARSGMGTPYHPFGWADGLKAFAISIVDNAPHISARQLAQRIVQRASQIDKEQLCDDATCIVLYCREPRKLIVASGPPYHKNHDVQLAQTLNAFAGKKVVCGGTTANILARELGKTITVNMSMVDTSLPPTSVIDGIDLVTEGILTLGKTAELLESQPSSHNTGPAEQLYRLLMESDDIHFLVGTRVNEAHQDPNLPIELEIRRNVIKKIATLLEDKHLKSTHIQYL